MGTKKSHIAERYSSPMGLKHRESDIGSHLTDGGDVDVGVVEEEHVDGTADADAVLPEDVVLFALRRQHGLLLFRAWK